MLLIGIVLGALASGFYTGMRSGDPDRLGSGLGQLLDVPRVDVETPMLTLPADRAPARTAFDFFTVLPDERVIPAMADSVETETQEFQRRLYAASRLLHRGSKSGSIESKTCENWVSLEHPAHQRPRSK